MGEAVIDRARAEEFAGEWNARAEALRGPRRATR